MSEWNTYVNNWQVFFDDVLGIGKFEACRTYWIIPRFKPKSSIDYDAAAFLTKKPDQILRLALERKHDPVISNAMEFINQFGNLTSGSTRIEIFDKYLLSIQGELMQFTEHGIEHQTKFDSKRFNRQIHSLNLILRSLPDSVTHVNVYSDMLSWRTFRNAALVNGLKTSKTEYYNWADNSFIARQNAMKTIVEGLTREGISTTITFFDCFRPNSEISVMEHDRFVKLSQNRCFISSGGFNVMWNALNEDELEHIDLYPKTFMIQVANPNPIPPNLRLIHKETLSLIHS